MTPGKVCVMTDELELCLYSRDPDIVTEAANSLQSEELKLFHHLSQSVPRTVAVIEPLAYLYQAIMLY